MTFCVTGTPEQNMLTIWQLLRLSLEMPHHYFNSYIVSDVQEFAYANNMQLNPSKCKVMSVNFLHYNSYQCPTSCLGRRRVRACQFLQAARGLHG